MITPGPQRGPRVTQQISVLHMEQRSQSQPHFFIRTTAHVGQGSASPLSTISLSIAAVLFDSWSVSLENLISSWYCRQFFPVCIAYKFYVQYKQTWRLDQTSTFLAKEKRSFYFRITNFAVAVQLALFLLARFFFCSFWQTPSVQWIRQSFAPTNPSSEQTYIFDWWTYSRELKTTRLVFVSNLLFNQFSPARKSRILIKIRN